MGQHLWAFSTIAGSWNTRLNVIFTLEHFVPDRKGLEKEILLWAIDPPPAVSPYPSQCGELQGLGRYQPFFHKNCSFLLGLCLNFLGMEGRADVTTTPGNAVAWNYYLSDMLYRYTWKPPFFPSLKIHGSSYCIWELWASDSHGLPVKVTACSKCHGSPMPEISTSQPISVSKHWGEPARLHQKMAWRTAPIRQHNTVVFGFHVPLAALLCHPRPCALGCTLPPPSSCRPCSTALQCQEGKSLPSWAATKTPELF